MAAQAGDEPGDPPAPPARKRVASGQHAADGVERAQRVLEIDRVLGLRPAGELHAHRPGPPAHVHHLPVNAQAEQHVAVVARAEPELVAVPAAGERRFGRRGGKRVSQVGVDGPALAQPGRRDDAAQAPRLVRDHSPVEQQLAEPGHVAGGAAQPAVMHGHA